MSEFLERSKPEAPAFLESTLGAGETTAIHPNVRDTLAFTYAQATGRSVPEVRVEMDNGFLPHLSYEANSTANQRDTERATADIQQTVDEQVDPEVAAERMAEARENLIFKDFVAPDIAAIMAENSPRSAKERRIFNNAVAAERIVAEQRAQQSEGVWATVGYLGDAMVSPIIHNVLGPLTTAVGSDALTGGTRLTELAEEASFLILSDLPKEDFDRRFRDILGRVADAGFTTESNPFYLEQFLDMVNEMGAGPTSGMEAAFQVLDIAGVVGPAITRAARGAGQLRNVPKVLSETAGVDAATDAVVANVRRGEDNAITVEGGSPSMTRPASAGDNAFASPALEARRALEAENAALTAIREAPWASYVDPVIVAQKEQEWIDEFKEANKGFRRQEIDYSIRVDGLGNIFGVATLGKRGATPYTTKIKAQALADKVGGVVREVTEEGKTKYVVDREWAIATEGLADPTDVNELASHFLTGIVSTTAKTTPRLDGILKRGEAQVSRQMREIGRAYSTALRATPKRERNNVDNLLRKLRDDPNENFRTEPLTTQEFRSYYVKQYNEEPSAEAMSFYKALQDLNDVDYYLMADREFKEAVNNGEKMAQLGGNWFRVKEVTPEPDNFVYNTDTNTLQRYSDLDPERVVIYEVKNLEFQPPDMGKVRYVTGSKVTTRRLYHTDVLPYNVGGHRRYTDPWEFYIKQDGGDVTLAGGEIVTGKPITMMAVRTENEARRVVAEFNTIVDALKKNLPTDQINQVIARNSSWHDGIEDIADLQNFADEQGLDLTRKIALATDGEPIEGASFAGEGTIGQAFRSNVSFSKRRGSRPLLGFGGEALDAMDPSTAITRGFMANVSRQGDAAYLFQATNGWVKAAKETGSVINENDLIGLSPRAWMEQARLRGGTKASQALEAERKTIQNRASNSRAETAIQSKIMRDMASFVYDKEWKKLSKSMDWAATGDPIGFLRSVAFHSKLGLFAFDQVYVQASQLMNITGITSATLGMAGSVRAMTTVPALRMAMVDDIPRGALERIAKAQAPFTGFTPDEFITLRNWIKQTGRNVIDMTVVEENRNFGALTPNRFLKWGQTFFNEGEMMARFGAAAANFAEHKARYGNLDNVFDNNITNQLIRRQDVLTASMTAASSAQWQKQWYALPLQFTTYHVRMMEQLLGGVLTGAEKRRLMLTHLFVYGAAAAPAAGWFLDRAQHEGKVPVDDKLWSIMRYGFLDAGLEVLSEPLGGSDTAISTRLAVGEGLFDLLHGLATDGLFETVQGPGGQIGADIFSDSARLINTVLGGKWDYVGYDWNRLARNLTSYNRAYNLWVAAAHGEYVNRKTQQTTIANLTTSDAFMLAMGIPLEEQARLWDSVQNLRMDDQKLNTHIKEIKRLDKIMKDSIQSDDWEAAGRTANDIRAMLEIIPAKSDLEKVLAILRKDVVMFDAIVDTLVKSGRAEAANKLQELNP